MKRCPSWQRFVVIDGLRYSTLRERGIGSDFIVHLNEETAALYRQVVGYHRESTEEQSHLLAPAELEIRERLALLGVKIDEIFSGVETSKLKLAERPILLAAIQRAKEQGVPLLILERDRILRCISYNGKSDSDVPFLGEFLCLEKLLSGTPLLSLHHPNLSGRGPQTKRGQRASDSLPGRPRKETRGRGWALRRKAALIGRSRELKKADHTYREIADQINASRLGWPPVCFATVRNWLKSS